MKLHFPNNKRMRTQKENAVWSKDFQGILESCDEKKVDLCSVRAEQPWKVRTVNFL